ncbi:MAG: hypothetical protein LBI18_07110, partial [Planctomycetaceae bacterium]|nr:hypothetical protein [Planctomycetaceae bacterium]
MLRATYTDDDKKSFHHFRYHYPDARIMRRFEILWLHACGKFAPEIANIVQQHVHTVRDVINMFQRGGIELVTTIDSNHPKSDLEEYRVSIIEEFTKRPPASAKEAAIRIEQ